MYASRQGNVTGRLWHRLVHLLLPAPCLACGEPVWETRDSLGLCPPCRGRLLRWPRRGCGVCARPLTGADLPAGYRCGECRKHPPPYGRLLSAWSYQTPADAVLMGLKFQRLEYLGAHLGRRLAKLFHPELADCDLIVPVPLHWRRFLGRGYNQAAVIARPLARALGLPVVGVLRRRRPTPPQSRLDRAARRRNLRGAFAVRRPGRCRDRHILLVDDVVTTGATLEAAARCLRRAGAREITALTAARTPTRKEAQHLPKAPTKLPGPTAPPARS